MWERRDIPLIWTRGPEAPPTFSNGAVRLATLFQIALVIFFRAPELRSGLDLRYDRSIKSAAFADLLLRLFRRGFLLR